MLKRLVLVAMTAALAYGGYALAQFPILDMVADRVVSKYQTATCEQLFQDRGKPKSEEEQRVIGILRNDPQMQQTFINKVAAPIANKLFTCGIIP